MSAEVFISHSATGASPRQLLSAKPSLRGRSHNLIEIASPPGSGKSSAMLQLLGLGIPGVITMREEWQEALLSRALEVGVREVPRSQLTGLEAALDELIRKSHFIPVIDWGELRLAPAEIWTGPEAAADVASYDHSGPRPLAALPGLSADRVLIDEPRCTGQSEAEASWWPDPIGLTYEAIDALWIRDFVDDLTLEQVKAIQDAFLLSMLVAAVPGLVPFSVDFVPRNWVSVCGTDRLAGPLVPRGPQAPALSAVRSSGHGAGLGQRALVLAA
ncbi:hypothetical protein ACFV4P_34785 [Kitasatospora sp. NPDC059795]|uniref:hypothetical protein n=1 Tax=Kitasatospora sp. NPDC059795 TaxID=3346949 RepID=UPI00364B9816